MKEKTLFKVRFLEKNQKDVTEVVVRHVEPSPFPGLILLHGFVFYDHLKKIILPEEEQAGRRFRQTKALHIPFPHVLMVEEVLEEPMNVHELPFLRSVDDRQGDEDKGDTPSS